jgi:hypothetical protein
MRCWFLFCGLASANERYVTRAVDREWLTSHTLLHIRENECMKACMRACIRHSPFLSAQRAGDAAGAGGNRRTKLATPATHYAATKPASSTPSKVSASSCLEKILALGLPFTELDYADADARKVVNNCLADGAFVFVNAALFARPTPLQLHWLIWEWPCGLPKSFHDH